MHHPGDHHTQVLQRCRPGAEFSNVSMTIRPPLPFIAGGDLSNPAAHTKTRDRGLLVLPFFMILVSPPPTVPTPAYDTRVRIHMA